jgi:ABC-type transport system involved in cytochrome c biogenesis permease subunit
MKPRSAPLTPSADPEYRLRHLPAALLIFFGLVLVSALVPPKQKTRFDLNGFGQLPVLNGGRTKPIDTVARTSLLVISGKQTVHLEDRTLSALEWLTQVLFQPGLANAYSVFEIDDPDVLGLMGIQQTNKRRYSFAELEPHLAEIEKQATQADQIKPEMQTRFQTAVLTLQSRLTLYQKLQNTLQVAGAENMTDTLRTFESKIVPALRAVMNRPHKDSELADPQFQEVEKYRFLEETAEFYPLPLPRASLRPHRWISFGTGVLNRLQTDKYHTGIWAYAAMSDAQRVDDPVAFNEALHSFQTWLSDLVPEHVTEARWEFVFNYFEPFYQSMLIYVTVFLLVFCSWITWPKTLNRSAFYLLLLALAVHTVGLVSRMILQGRPPVTNLYSSAIFVGWMAVVLGVILEKLYKNGIGSMVASAIGFITLIIAHHLATSGDTLEMMRAVLDSNFWLATHVVCITIGYSSTFLTGFLATLYILRRIFDRHWDDETAQSVERMVYGIVCFSMFFSFLGTILGGIWADQSWGRFWGWDPKENGALMIVLWNAFILHARWGGLAKNTNLMMLAVFGNIVTAMSWFGVNMLGIGLHSYGFMEKAFVWLMIFAASQLLVIALGFVPDYATRRYGSTVPRAH